MRAHYPNMTKVLISRKREKTSVCWNHFTEVLTKENVAKCNHCGKEVTSVATSNMLRHMQNSHPGIDITNAPEKKPTHLIQVELKADGSLCTPMKAKISTSQQHEFDQSLIDMIVKDLLPFNTVNNIGFQSFVSTLRPGYVLPSRPKLQELLDERFLEKQKMLVGLCQSADYISYTTDLWKSTAKQYYISVALHFIDKNWQLHAVLICTSHIQGSHKKDVIGNLVAEKMKPFLALNAKVHTGVTDGGEIASVSHTSTVLSNKNKYMKTIESRLCICHQLNNTLKRFLVGYLGKKYILPWRGFISHLNFSNPFFELFCSCRSQVFGKENKEKLQRDCETRWSSTALMLQKAEKFRKVVNLMLLSASIDMKPHIPVWSSEEWVLLIKMNEVLKPVLNCIKVLEGDSYPTQNLILLAISMLTNSVKETQTKCVDKTTLFYKILIDLQNELNIIWHSLPQESLIATLVDPRFKSLSHVPEEEHHEAWKCLETEYYNPTFLVKSSDTTSSQSQMSSKIVAPTTKRKREDEFGEYMAKILKPTNDVSQSEFERYKLMPPISYERNPLDWWRENEATYPVIAEIARIYLAIPASQATCERSFSTSKRVCSDARTSLTASNVEKLTLLKQNANALYEYETAVEEEAALEMEEETNYLS